MKKNLLLLSSSLFIAFILSELTVRVFSLLSPQVNFLATAGLAKNYPVTHTLEEFIESKSVHLQPNRKWQNYYANQLGFYDQEFKREKSETTFRILALGDSFTFGMVSYPDSAMTLLEDKLNESPALIQSGKFKKVEILNFGIPATGVWDYKTLADFVIPLYHPDLVLVNFYLGNDGPDLFHHYDDFPNSSKYQLNSLLFNLVKNLTRYYLANKAKNLEYIKKRTADSKTDIRGGSLVDSNLPPHSEARAMYNEKVLSRMYEDELGKLYYTEKDQQESEERWQKVYFALDKIANLSKSINASFVISFFPSQLQVNPQKLDEIGKSESIDPELPNKMLNSYCSKKQISCFDLTGGMKEDFEKTKTPLYLEDDVHWNLQGNKVAAELLGQFLSRKFPSQQSLP
ncbi:MAG: SGNH/GDSL hydrolase family protein [Proteobacteria bacterium]|nr:SGNH/GDSL hydrolase family protein [Pseudomonadota bacterium]